MKTLTQVVITGLFAFLGGIAGVFMMNPASVNAQRGNMGATYGTAYVMPLARQPRFEVITNAVSTQLVIRDGEGKTGLILRASTQAAEKKHGVVELYDAAERMVAVFDADSLRKMPARGLTNIPPMPEKSDRKMDGVTANQLESEVNNLNGKIKGLWEVVNFLRAAYQANN